MKPEAKPQRVHQKVPMYLGDSHLKSSTARHSTSFSKICTDVERCCAERLLEATKMADRHALNMVLQAAKCGAVFAALHENKMET